MVSAFDRVRNPQKIQEGRCSKFIAEGFIICRWQTGPRNPFPVSYFAISQIDRTGQPKKTDRTTASSLRYFYISSAWEAALMAVAINGAYKSINSGRESKREFSFTGPHISHDNRPRRTRPPATKLFTFMLPKALSAHNPMKASLRARSGRPSKLRKMAKIVAWVRHLPEIRFR